MVRLAGFEPATFGFEVHCSIQLSYKRTIVFGANDEDRTRDHQSHNLALYQLSYIRHIENGTPETIRTSDLLIRSQLLYPTELRAQLDLVGVAGFEPATPCSQSRCASQAALHPEQKHSFCRAKFGLSIPFQQKQ